MKRCKSFLLLGLLTAVITNLVIANPIPVPPPASMPLEQMQVVIQSDGSGLQAVFSGQFTFDYIPQDITSMLFPVPPGASSICVRRDDAGLSWEWSGELYPTVLPELPTIPMIEWQGPFPIYGAEFFVDYEHDLIERPQEFIFFYALGTGKYFPTYDKTTTAHFDIQLPAGYAVTGVRLDETPHAYEVIDSHLMITVESSFGPIVNDLIVSLVPTAFAGCGVVVEGIECVLFQADTGRLYALQNRGGFSVGDRVLVTGLLNPDCETNCMQVDGCIEDNSISVCCTGDFNADSDVDGYDFAVLALAWLSSPGADNWNPACDVSEQADGHINMLDLAAVADNWLGCEPSAGEKPGLARFYAAYENTVEPSAPGYALPLDLGAVGNYDHMSSRFDLSASTSLLEQNGFTIIEHDFKMPDDDRDDITTPYKYLYEMGVPLFVTSDTLLHLYHIQFDETLKDIEEREFFGDIRDLTGVLLDDALAAYEELGGDLKEAARRNVAYLAVARKLIEPTAGIPAVVAAEVAGELARIDAHAGFAPSDIFIYEEDYSQYVPRGHYTRSPELERYFRTLMWYGRMAFLLKGAENWGRAGDALISVYDAKIQTMQAVLLATSLDSVSAGERTGRDIWERIYAVTSFYVGLADDLTPYEYLGAIDKVFGGGFVPGDLEDEERFFDLKVELSLLRSPEIFGGTGNVFVNPPVTPETLDEVLDKTKGMRFMGQRFIPDSYMFQHLVFPEVLDYTGAMQPLPFTCGSTGVRLARCYPRGLDLMGILGSTRAEAILAAEGDTEYIDYALRFSELKAKFDALDISDWNRNLYWSWLYSLRALIEGFGDGYPNFMRTEAWEKKGLNAALASWTELRHDTILYAKQSYTPGETSVPPTPVGYVEPVPDFYGRLLALTRMTREGLSDLDALSGEAQERLVNLENILSRLIEIVNKELTNQELSEDDRWYIGGFAKALERVVTGVDEQGVKTTLVADVHTHTVEQTVVEEGVGYVDIIIVACSMHDGSVLLAAGPVLSHYEFKHPMSDRLTDEAWRALLDSPQKPARAPWFQPFVH